LTMTLADRLSKAGVKGRSKSSGPLWLGPESDAKNGGVTQSLIGRFLSCRERFRLYAIEGLRGADGFNHRLEFGSMFHVCAENLMRGNDPTNRKVPLWQTALAEYCRGLCRKYQLQQSQIDHWYRVCLVTFPLYVDFWKKHQDRSQRVQPLLREQVFCVPYKLPSGRTVFLKGKWDSVDRVTENDEPGVWLLDHKTKGEIKEDLLQQQLTCDLQLMFYMVALYQRGESYIKLCNGEGDVPPIEGAIYDVVRRPLSGGKGTIVRRKETRNRRGETLDEFYKRLGAIIQADPEYFFMRWTVPVLPSDVERFRRETLDPILEQMAAWYDWTKNNSDPFRDECGVHWRAPFGRYDPVAEGVRTEYDDVLQSGSTSGLRRVETLFPELEEVQP
jgi:hypothetical protein